MIRIFRNILLYFIQAIIALNLVVLLALNVPFVQSQVGNGVASILSDLLETEVSIGRVDFMLNQLVVTDMEVKDQQHQPLLSIRKLTARVDIFRLKPHHIAFNTIQLLGFEANLSQAAADAPTNFQFIIDALSSEEKSDTPTHIRINSLIVRGGDIHFDKAYQPQRPTFDLNHLHIQDLNAHLSLKSVVKDSIQVRLRQLSFKEQSGLDLRRLSLKAEGDSKHLLVTQFQMQFPHSSMSIDSLFTTYDMESPDILASIQSRAQVQLAPLTLADFSCIVPKLADFHDKIITEVTVEQEGRSIGIKDFQTTTRDQNLKLTARADIQLPTDSTQLDITAHIQQLEVQPSGLDMLFHNLQLGAVPAVLTRLTPIRFNGDIHTDGQHLTAQGLWHTAAGLLDTDVQLAPGNTLKGKVATHDLHIGQITDHTKLGEIDCQLQVDGVLKDGKPSGHVAGEVTSLVYNDYTVRDAQINAHLTTDEAKGTLSLNDENLRIDIDGLASLSHKTYDLKADIQHLRPSALGIQPNQDRTYQGVLTAQFQGDNIDNLLGTISIDNLSVQDSTSTYHMNRLNLRAANDDGQRRVSLFSDFMTAELRGNYTYTTLPKSFIHVLERYIPSLVDYQKPSVALQNHFTFNVRLTDATPLQQVLNLPIEIQEPVTLIGFFNDVDNKLDIDLMAGSFDYSNSHYEQARVRCHNDDQTFLADMNLNKFNKSSMVTLGVHAQAQNDKVDASITWDNNKDTNAFRGQLNANADFHKIPGLPMEVGIRIHPSDVTINDTIWNIRPAQVYIKGKEYAVNNLTVENGDRHLRVNGVVSENPSDSLIAELKDINVEYVLSAVNFHAVNFSGYASGKAYASNLLHDMQADVNLFVRDFRFEDGLMGNMNLYGRWENDTQAIYANGHITEFGANAALTDSAQIWRSWQGLGDYIGRTHVEGRISPKHNTIDLMIDADNTSVAFLKGFVGNIFDNISGRATGWCRIGNTLKNIDLTAGLKAELQARVRSLNTTYTIKTDSAMLLTNHMRFINATITDRDGRTGMAQGDVWHDYLHRLKYDFRIKTDNLLSYETHDFSEGMPFYATAYAGGDISIVGQSGQLNINADVTANAGSIMVYDATVPEEVSNTQFITFVDKTPRIEQAIVTEKPKEENDKKKEKESTNIYIDLNVNMAPETTIRVLMDRISGDFISANGTGNLKASYYNKGTFKMFGLYHISKGLYRMSMQEVIRKDFNLQDGGVVNFNGNPFSAQLNVKAAYTVNSASLRDLSPTATFTQKTSTRVNCIMNIEGSLRKPSITFDLELPAVSEEDKSMVKSLVATEEQMNMQIIYLLGVGRFYGGDYAQTGNQTNQAMNSILTSTLSGQFNQMLSQVINSNNWNLGANINPGTNGMNDMEFQTMLQGSLFNNRLLINGNFGYRESVMMNTNFVGDFDVQWLLNNAGSIRLKAYNETNDRYFTKNTLNTQGLGILFRHEFENWRNLFRFSKRKSQTNE